MYINIVGGKQYQKKYAESLIQFCGEHLMSYRLRSKLYIECKIQKGFTNKKGIAGECGWEDDNVRPKEFEIVVDQGLKLRELLTTIAHEMVHVKQFARGEMRDLTVAQKTSWLGKHHDTDKLNYWDRPWEIEAHGRELGLFIRWAEDNELAKYKWTQQA